MSNKVVKSNWPGPKRVFHGWWIILVILLAGLFAGPTSQSFIAILVLPVSAETGWTTTQIAGSVTVGGILAGITAPAVGYLADRYSPRYLMTIGIALLGGSFLLMWRITELWHLYLGYFIIRGVAQNLVAGVVPRVIVVHWFRRMRGRAIGLVHTAHPVGTFAVAPLALIIIDAGLGWRSVWLYLGIATLVLLVIPAFLVLRDTPEEMGLRPDGENSDATDDRTRIGVASVAAPERSWTLREAMKTQAFWLVMIAVLLGNFGGGGLPFHMPIYYAELGLASSIGVAAISMFAISGAIANTLWGFIAEHMSERFLAAGTMFLGAILAAGLTLVNDPLTAVLYGGLLGIAVRGEGSILMILLAQYFGRSSYGVISGIATQALLIGLALGPVSISLLRDQFGGYNSVFMLVVFPFLAAALLLIVAKKPTIPITNGVPED